MELSAKRIKELQKQDDAKLPKISIYIPTQPKSTSQSINEDSIRLKNAIKIIENHSELHNGDDFKATIKKLHDLVDNLEFWKHQTAGLAIFADKDDLRTVHLPYATSEFYDVSKSYFVSPLLAMESMGLKYYVLEINTNNPKLFMGSEFDFKLIEDANLPGSIEDEFELEERRTDVQTRATRGGGAHFFGHGKEDESNSIQTDKYLNLLAGRINAFLKNDDSGAPLLLCGADSRINELRPMLTYEHILNETVALGSDVNNITELHNATNAVIGRYSKKKRVELVDGFRSADSERQLDGLTAVIDGAGRGVVDTLLLPVIQKVSEPAQGSIHALRLELPEDMNKFEEAVRATVTQGGRVQAVDIEDFADDPSVKALTRY